MKQYDAIIIGFGKAGKTLAAELSNRGWQVAIVERSNMMYGGSCPNVASIPTKTLVHEAEVSALLYHDDFPKQANMYKQAIGRKNRLTSFLRNDNYERLSKRPNVTIYTGTGSFISADTIKVELPEGEIELKGKEIFINTGSTPIIPAIDGIQQSQHVYTSSALLDLSVLPHHLIIIGGGYIGLEFASMYAGFGSKVTILEGGNKFMPREDRDIANSVKEVMEKKGIEIHLNARAQSIHDTNDGVTLTYSDISDGTPYYVDGDAILIATGRKPMIEGLNLQAAGVGVDAHGAIIVNDQLRTTVPHIWAMGDVKVNDPIYQNTRKFVWSEDNPYFFKGTAGEGIGGPHIGYDMIWPMSIMMKAFTSQNDAEIKTCIKMLMDTDAGTGFMHESFHKNDPKNFTRSWFAWQNTLFGELILKLVNEGKVDLLNSIQ